MCIRDRLCTHHIIHPYLGTAQILVVIIIENQRNPVALQFPITIQIRARHTRLYSCLLYTSMYVLSSDNWIRDNMFHSHECGAWYASSYMKGDTSEWVLSYNKKGRITDIQIGGSDCWVMYGPCLLYTSRCV